MIPISDAVLQAYRGAVVWPYDLKLSAENPTECDRRSLAAAIDCWVRERVAAKTADQWWGLGTTLLDNGDDGPSNADFNAECSRDVLLFLGIDPEGSGSPPSGGADP